MQVRPRFFVFSTALIASLSIAAPLVAFAQAASPEGNASTTKDVLTLPDAITEALKANPDTQAAQQATAQAQARLGQANAQRRIQVQFTSTGGASSVNVIQPPPAYQNFGTLQNGISVTIPTGARPRLASVQAREQLTAAQAQFQTARIALATQVTGAYFDLLRKQALGEIAHETRIQAERQLSEITKRYRSGDVPELDTLRAQVPVSSAKAGEYQAESDIAIAQQTLNILLGRPAATPLTPAEVPPTSADATLPYSQEEAKNKAIAVSQDILASDANVRAAEAALASARRFRDPALSLQALDTRSNDKTGFSRDDTVQASITLPLSDGGLGRAQVKEAEAAFAQAKAQTAIAHRAVETAIITAYLTAESRQKQIQAALVARDIAITSYEKTAKGYQAGLFSLSDLLNAQTALTQAKIAYTQALYDAALATSNLAITVGGAQSIAPISPSTSGTPTIP